MPKHILLPLNRYIFILIQLVEKKIFSIFVVYIYREV